MSRPSLTRRRGLDTDAVNKLLNKSVLAPLAWAPPNAARNLVD